MRKLCFALLLIPFLVGAQEAPPTPVFQNVVISAQVGKVSDFETSLAAHNKAFHANAEHGCRVYSIASGKDIGKYVWAMGPTSWAALDNRPGGEEHDKDWANVTKHTESGAHGTFWTGDLDLSHFPNNFTLNKLRIMYVDVKRNAGEEVGYLLGKIREAYAAELADELYGIYWNASGSMADGRDLAIVWFFDSWSWMDEGSDFNEKFEKVHGEGSWSRWLDDWIEATNGTELEFWVFRPDLSGLSGEANVASQ